MNKKILSLAFIASIVFSFSFTSFFQHQSNLKFLNNLAFAKDQESLTTEEKDDFCSEELKGTASKESCLVACPAGQVCALAKKFEADDYQELEEDLECFGCRKKICEDFGRLGAAAKARCDARPDYESKPAAPLPDGTLCWSCEKIVDQCKDKWPGSTLKATCEAQCKDPTKICAKLGNYKGKDCYACVPKKNPKPPKTCNDLGAITNAQCGTCVDPTPDCKPAGFRDGTGRICFKCQAKPKNCKDIGKTNRSICNDCRKNKGKCVKDGRAPNGEQCYTCEDRQCKDIGKTNRSICKDCRAKRDRCIPDGRSPAGERCYQCKDLKSCKDEGRDNRDVCKTCADDEVCRYVKTAEDGERCYKCKKKPKKKTCEDEGKLDEWGCETCEDDPDTKCEPDGTAEDGTQCYKCVEKKGCEKADLEEGDCQKDSCSEDQKCIPSSVQDGSTCHECVEKQCYDYDGLKESCANNETCTPQEPREGLQCCECKPKTCEGEGLKKSCDAETEICQEVSKNGLECCDCRKKNCGDIQKQDSSMCSSCEANGGTCVDNGTAPNGDQCKACQEKTTPPPPPPTCDPEKGEFPGGCPSSGDCYDGRKCVPIEGKDCHKCEYRDKQSDCSALPGSTPQPNCGGKCPPALCEKQTIISYGKIDCYKCKEKSDLPPPPQCDALSGEWPNQSCGNTCNPQTQTCIIVADNGCYGCVPLPSREVPPKDDEIIIGDPIGTVTCASGYQPGTCGEQIMCSPENCFGFGGCFTCREPAISACKPEFLNWSDCGACNARGGVCRPVGRDGQVMPLGVRGPIDGISGATPLGGSPLGGGNPFGGGGLGSPDVHSCMISTINPPLLGGPCYQCVPRESCEALGQVCDCGACPLGTTCIPGNIIPNPETGDMFMCKRCIENDIIETAESIEITWIIIIIETPRGRYILEKGESDGVNPLEGFKAHQVMALAQVDSATGGLKQLASGLMPSAASAFGMISGGVNLESLASTLKQGMEKGRKYTDDCFDKNFDVEPLPEGVPENKSAASSKKSKKKQKKDKNAPPTFKPDSEYGFDPEKEIVPDGPIVACGSVDGEKALAVLDSAGKPIEIIFKDQLKENPNAIVQALTKAHRASQMVMDLQKGGVQGLLKRATNVIKKKVTEVVEAKVESKKEKKKKKKKKKKKGEVKKDVVPNDPYYAAPFKKKKKKLLGILGSSKEAPKKISIGSNIRMGRGSLGGGGVDLSKKDSKVKYQWGLHEIGYLPLSDPTSAWHFVDEDSRNILVAVIDSGFDFTHPDAPQYTWVNEDEIADNGIDDDNNGYVDDVKGWNFLHNNNDLTDEKGHGSFVAGIIAAKKDNGVGIAGINPGAVIMPIKVADSEGETNSFLITRAIYYAVDNGAQIINLSLGGRVVSKLEQAALTYAYRKGVFVVSASGNVGENIADHGPASEKGTMAIGSLDQEGSRSTISNWGPNNGLLAPGDEIYSLIARGTGKGIKKSLLKQGYYPQSGTSFSTPMVAATASLLLVQNPHLTHIELEDILHRTTDEMYTSGWDGQSGAGLLNATAALTADVNDEVTVIINETRLNINHKKQISSVDVFATVRGDFKSFSVELGKGKLAKKFKPVAGPFTETANNDWIVRLDPKESLRGSKEWILRIVVTGKNGQEKEARTLLELKK